MLVSDISDLSLPVDANKVDEDIQKPQTALFPLVSCS